MLQFVSVAEYVSHGPIGGLSLAVSSVCDLVVVRLIVVSFFEQRWLNKGEAILKLRDFCSGSNPFQNHRMWSSIVLVVLETADSSELLSHGPSNDTNRPRCPSIVHEMTE